ncbi:MULTISPECIES: type VI secretion system baseplate subunit TssE [Paraburkholderia]|uniref:Type VI secretion system protein ImpF n=2 Tax=Paraburkholderia TaxID=1822464 RepID=A0A1I3T8C5_9BURK|nr:MULTISPECIES: type VI secretion system baseplate subunit TssE [Paraburkholderia]MCX4165008.1 type VI secretion system baseplate subunit TssE [Paraburkholderia megapolitana]MDN7160501.1 type VI secretion system baseplate subunit TssE [Paraburkholderia sp. CHISQ3]MDQ6497548.1 type VI secretion system baseplate subunit TssE [Paraburkholderia megapolitana]PCE21955.1 type VI secretion protein [Paraburkholderia acidicola]QDQ81491.1 type VI secretion system baseplate subunit TssE [Paraburkholderia
MKRFEPSFLDKLFDDEPHLPASPAMRQLSLEELKATVARDVEAILNTRIALTEHELLALPECRKSVLTYGLNDFAGLSLASHYDRTFICKSIQAAIERHEPRLQQVAVTLEMSQQSTNALNFAIQALLVVHPAEEPVSFDAMLQPSTLQYSVTRARAKL